MTPNEQLRKLAEEAPKKRFWIKELDIAEGRLQERTYRFIAAANPSRVLELLDRVGSLEWALERAANKMDESAHRLVNCHLILSRELDDAVARARAILPAAAERGRKPT